MLNDYNAQETQDLFADLKTTRESKELTQQALALRVGLPQSHLSKIESGKVNVSLKSFIEIARHLDLEVMLVPRQKISAVKGVITAPSDFGSRLAGMGVNEPAYTLDVDEENQK